MGQREIDMLIEKINPSKEECKKCAYLNKGKGRYYKCCGSKDCPAKNL